MLHNILSLFPTAIGADGGNKSKQKHAHHSRPEEEIGKWIWIQNSEQPANTYIYARKLFKLASKPTRATLKASADTAYKLYINGKYVGSGPVKSGSGYTYYDTYDVTDLLDKGNNIIAFHAHHLGINTYSYIKGKPGLLCKAKIELGEKTEMIQSDESWKVIQAIDWTDQGARISEGLGFQEAYEDRAPLQDWNEIKFKQRGWENATVVGSIGDAPWGRIEPREIPHLHEEKINPVGIVGVYNSPARDKDTPMAEIPDIIASSKLGALRSGSVKDVESLLSPAGHAQIKTPRGDVGVVVILDFGKEVSGNTEIGLSTSGSGNIDIAYGEVLDGGRIKPNHNESKFVDRVTFKKGHLHWQGFSTRAFRYLQVEFRRCSKAVSLEYIRVNEVTYPVKSTGSFECSDQLLNNIWNASARTVKLCMQDTFVDSPWREKAQWWADARIEARTAYYAFGDTWLLAQGLGQIAQSQKQDGSILTMYPAGAEKMLPDYSLLWVFSILDYYAFSDDAGLVRRLYPAVMRLIEWFEGSRDDSGLLINVPGNLFIDWADFNHRGNVTALNCMYYQGLRVASVIASISGKQEKAEELAEESYKLKKLINKYLYNPLRGLYGECRVDGKLVEEYTRQTNILAALFDIPDHYQKSTILRQFLNGSSLPEVATPYFASYFLEALYSADKHEDALNFIRKNWGKMLHGGSTTLWERFDMGGSLCHGWSSCPGRDLIAEYVGIKPVLGAQRFSVTPHIAKLNWAKGTVETKAGLLHAEWRVNRNSLAITVKVPKGLKVDVYPPDASDATITLNGRVQINRIITVGEGTHKINVSQARLSKPPKAADGLKPPEIPHVELLREISQIGRSLSRLSRRRKPASRKTDLAASVPQVMPDNEILAEVPEAEVAEEIAATAVTLQEELPEAAQSKPKKKSRRGRRRGKSAEVEAAVAEEAVDVVEQDIPQPEETIPSETVSEPVAEEAPKPSKRRSRRGGRRHKAKTEEPVEAAAQAEESAPSVEETEPVQPEETQETKAEPTEEAPHKKRTRRGGRRHSHKKHSAKESAEQQAEAQQEAPLHSAAEAAAPSDPVPEAVSSETAVNAEDNAVVEEKPKRRTRRQAKPKKEKVAEVTSEPVVDIESEAKPEQAAPEAPKKKRTYRRRTKKTVEGPSEESTGKSET